MKSNEPSVLTSKKHTARMNVIDDDIERKQSSIEKKERALKH